MGALCARPQTIEWEPQRNGKGAWGNENELQPKRTGRSEAASESGSPQMIRAIHGGELQGAESVQPLNDRVSEEREQINWACGDCIGQGAFGKVVLGLNVVTGQLMAVKQIRLSSEQAAAVPVAEHVRKVEAEVDVLKQLNHSNIVRYLGTEKTDVHLNIFLEYVPGGSIASLLSKFGRFNESVIKIYTRQILLGLEYLHGNGIMHRDIKGANILVDNQGLVKLADFGASKKIESLATIDSGVKQSIKGTPHWMAPEVIHQKGVGRAADIWSVACTVIEMATGKPPWSHITSQVSVMLHIAQTHGPPPLPDTLSTACKDFLRLCFNRSARDRPNANRLLQHPFLEGVPSPSVTASPLSNISGAVAPPRALSQTEVPSPVQEESATPTSRGTGTTSSSSNRRVEVAVVTEDMSRFSPMGAAVRHSQISGLAPVKESSFEAVNSSNADVPQSVGASNNFVRLPTLSPPPEKDYQDSLDLDSPMLEPPWEQRHSPFKAASPSHGFRRKPSWPLLPDPGPKTTKEVGVMIEVEANEEHILHWVRTKARTDAARLSQSFKSLSLRQGPMTSPGAGGSQHSPDDLQHEPTGNEKHAQWEAELERELERQRQEQRRGSPVARAMEGFTSNRYQ